MPLIAWQTRSAISVQWLVSNARCEKACRAQKLRMGLETGRGNRPDTNIGPLRIFLMICHSQNWCQSPRSRQFTLTIMATKLPLRLLLFPVLCERWKDEAATAHLSLSLWVAMGHYFAIWTTDLASHCAMYSTSFQSNRLEQHYSQSSGPS